MPKLKISIPFCIIEAIAVSLSIFAEGLVSFAITHFFDFIKAEKLLQNFKTSFNVKSSPIMPLMPEIDFFLLIKTRKAFYKL